MGAGPVFWTCSYSLEWHTNGSERRI
jgi:hypothetical protein